ncbi:MAG: MFS transporter [Clostridia bacterium]|nr:MFS transporter [Clostridia bacterium]
MTMRFSPRQMVRLGQAILAAGCALMIVPLQAAMLAGLALCGLGCAPIYPNIIQDTPVNYGAENSQAAIGVQMASAYLGSTFAPSIFGALAGVVGYGALPLFALGAAALMSAMFGLQKRQVDRR